MVGAASWLLADPEFLQALRAMRPSIVGRGHIWPPARGGAISCVACGLTVRPSIIDGQLGVDLQAQPEIEMDCPSSPGDPS